MWKVWYRTLVVLLLFIPITVFAALNVPGGGTSSTTLTGILIGNGDNPVKSLTVGSGLVLTGTTLSATGGGGGSASSTLLIDNNTFSGVNSFTNSLSDFSGTWQTFAPSHFQVAGNYSNFGYLFPSNATSTVLNFTSGLQNNGIYLPPHDTATVCSSGCDYTNINTAVNAVAASSTVYIKNGTYALGATTVTIPGGMDISVIGQSEDGVVITYTGGGAAITIGDASLSTRHIQVSNFTIKGTSSGTDGLKLVQVKDSTIENIYSTGFSSTINPGQAFRLDGSGSYTGDNFFYGLHCDLSEICANLAGTALNSNHFYGYVFRTTHTDSGAVAIKLAQSNGNTFFGGLVGNSTTGFEFTATGDENTVNGTYCESNTTCVLLDAGAGNNTIELADVETNTTVVTDNGTANNVSYNGSDSGGKTYFNAGNFGIGTSTPKELLDVGKTTGYATVRVDSGVHSGYLSTNDLFPGTYVGSNSNDPVYLVSNNATIAQGYTLNGQSNIFEVDAPSGNPLESDLATVLTTSAGNRRFVDWDLENFPTDQFGSIVSAKQGTGVIEPFGIRFWNQDIGNVAETGWWAAIFDPRGVNAIGPFASTTSGALNAYPTNTVLSVGASSTVLRELSVYNSSTVSDANLALTVLQTGSVGIGTSTPTKNLDVYGSFPSVRISNSNSTQFAGAQFVLNNNIASLGNQASTVFYSGINDGAASQGYFAIDQGSVGGGAINHVFIVDYNAQSDTLYTNGLPRLTINSTGKVGVATTSPWAALSVEGISTLGNQAIAGFFTATSTTPSTFAVAPVLGTLTGLVSGNSGSLYATATSTLTASSPLTGSFVQVGSGGALGCTTADTSHNGCLTSTDWNTFNNKGSGTLTAVTGTYPVQSTGGNTPAISLAFGTTTANTWSQLQTFSNGFLSSASSTVNSTLALTNTLTYGGVTLANAVTGTNNMVLSSGPTLAGGTFTGGVSFTGTLRGSTGNGSTLTITGSTNAAPTTAAGIQFGGGGGGTTPLTFFQESTGNWGVGSTSPFARFGIHANPTDAGFTATLFAIASSTASATTTLFSVDNRGDNIYSGVAPTLASCTGGTVNARSNQTDGSITVGTGLTSCGVVFASPYPTGTTLHVFLNQDTGTVVLVGAQSVSTTGFTITSASVLTGDVFSYRVEASQ